MGIGLAAAAHQVLGHGLDRPRDRDTGSDFMSVDTASRIIPVERRNIFVFLTVLFCMVYVVPDMLGVYISAGLLVGYLIFFILVAVHAKNRDKIPRFLAGSADDTLTRLRETPVDILTMFGCIGLVVLKWQVSKYPELLHLLSIMLVAAAFWLSNRNRPQNVTTRRRSDRDKSPGGAKTLIMRLMGKGGKPEPAPAPKEEEEESYAGALDTVVYEGGGDGSIPPVQSAEDNERAQKMALWEQRQKERWDDWIHQELLRLNEDRAED
jgi:hypothetical protein